ncbi:outer membrane protein assembly factor BamE [Legionella impletisoli]|uniref:Outer membrane protein assembly factor BamE n=1 Tax=Legionella impletisoli TaxID=343510 RepID=A0A917JRZ8_9GAMM|nr:outer membrane protein assembly factor BamE [Legionella impletisoli]GGI83937.1 outer membrane protein assembly factor BamE [Legionella impletisoli]
MRIRNILIFLITFLLLSGCASYDFQKRAVQQGNLLPDSKIERLKIGMSKQDVAILMGTSLLSPVFNTNRWDYAYTWRKGNVANEVRNISLYFKNDRLVRIEYNPR